jgi:hypothetical protein
MYSAKNSLKVWISNFSYPFMSTSASTIVDLPVGGIGFYTEAGVLLPDGTGTGFVAFRRPDGSLLKSKVFTSATTWLNRLNGYTAPGLEKVKLVPVAANSTLYQVRIEMQIPGMGGSYIKHGQYKSDGTATIAEIVDGLVTSLTNAFSREPQSYFTFSNVGNELVIETKHLTYVRGKKSGRPAWFKASLTLPETQAAIATLVTNHSDGSGYAPYVAEKEFFAQGDSDAMRFAGYPNSFDDRALLANVNPALAQYNLVALTIDTEVKTNNASVYAPQQYLLAFNDIGVTPTPIITDTTYAAGNITPAGFAAPGSTVTVYKDGVATGTPVTANATSGAFTYGVTAVLAGNVITVRSVDGNASVSAASNAITVTP